MNEEVMFVSIEIENQRLLIPQEILVEMVNDPEGWSEYEVFELVSQYLDDDCPEIFVFCLAVHTWLVDESEMYLFLHEGQVQDCEHDGELGLLFARGKQAAVRFAEVCNTVGSREISLAPVGSVRKETLESHIVSLMEQGSEGTWFTYDGELLHWHPYEEEEDIDND